MGYDVLIIGSGAAGLSLALQLAPHLKVGVMAKADLLEGSTYYAQGGIAAVLDDEDSIESHIEDTLNAGGGLCYEPTVRLVVETAREVIDRLIAYGVDFTKMQGSKGQYHLTREGGHSHRRVIHAADATGKAVETTLEQLARNNPNIALFEHHLAVDLVKNPEGACIGAYGLNLKSGEVRAFPAKFVVLATGGASRVYLYSSNPNGSTGDGIAMAWRAGCRVANLEFSQFHPTCLFHPHARNFLVTEAVRGEGGLLRLPNGQRFMDRFDKRAELAPRDIVARAIDHEMKRLGLDCVYLDISHKPADFIKEHFPTVYGRCLELGIDITKEPMPVVPAAHYTCGGVVSGPKGQTDVDRLYAIGEVAFTGLHGANRMASNSLLECLVYADAAAKDILSRHDGVLMPGIKPWDESWVTNSDEEVVVAHNWDELRRFMWDYVGIVRSTKRLQRAKRRVDLLLAEIAEYYSRFRVSNDLLELRNLSLVADLIIRSALSRKESRGLHYTIDFPKPDDTAPPQNTIMVPENYRQGG